MEKPSVYPIKCVAAGTNSKGFWALLAREEHVTFRGKSVLTSVKAFIISDTEDLSDWEGSEFTDEDLKALKVVLK